MLKTTLTIGTLTAIALFSPTATHANEQETGKAQTKAEYYDQVVADKMAKTKNPAEKVRYTIAKFMKNLSEENSRHFMLIYTNYNMVETVKIVRGDVGNAIKSCGENNPDMKAQLDIRFSQWKQKIDPIMEEARAQIDNLLIAQDYAKKKEIEDIFKLVDKTRDETKNRFKKIPVTSKEGCEYMLEKMDETQPEMESLLNAAITTTPSSLLPSEPKK